MSHVTLVQTKPGEHEFRLPDIGEGVVEGEIVKWLVKEGDTVDEDQPIVEIMTDKATVEIPSPKAGKIVKLFWAEGGVCPVGKPLLLIADEGAATAQVASSVPAAAAPAAAAVAAAAAAPQAAAPVAAPAAPAAGGGGRALASPATRKLARESGIDLQSVPGSGPQGRVTRADVQSVAQNGASAPAANGSSPPERKLVPIPQPVVATGEVERLPIRGLRKKIAEKMVQSAFTAPHVTTFDEVDMTAVMALRNRLKPKAEAQGIKLSFMPFIIKAAIATLKQFPHFNASVDDTTNEIVIKKAIHMGFAAATDNGLMVPVIKNAQLKSLFAIAKEIPVLAEKTRDGKASLDELTGSTFTISNVGSIGGLFATPIINFPEVAILGVNKIEKRPVVRDGEIVIRDMMYLGLSFDHRIIDGAEAVQFLNTLIGYLHDPDLLFGEM